ncbi:hypothetical protein AB7M17_008111 [Bradyrhizobium sp. USDA 377]
MTSPCRRSLIKSQHGLRVINDLLVAKQAYPAGNGILRTTMILAALSIVGATETEEDNVG